MRAGQIRVVSVRDNESKETVEGSRVFLVMYLDTIVRKASNDERLLFSTRLLWAQKETSYRAPRVIGLEVLVPLRITVEATMTPGRPRERELLKLDFVNGDSL